MMMGSKPSVSNSKHLDKPFRRIEFGLFPVLTCFTFGVGVYSLCYKRKINEVCLGPTIGVGLFFFQRLCLFLQELITNRHNDVSLTLRLISQSSNLRGGNEHGFWIKLIFFIIGLTQLPPLEIWFENKVDIIILLITIVIGIHFGWYDCALLESHRLEKPFSYSGGSAMALSFYYGYLKLITPELVDRINRFIYNEQIDDEQIPQKKLFVLIPSSSFIFDKLEGYQQCTKTRDLKIDPVGEKFTYHKQDRGLVKGRTYKNTMYIVEYPENKKYYVLLEGATPIKTFYETCKEHNEFERHKKEVISSFYITLKTLIRENKQMKGVVKLIYYDDEKRDVTVPDIIKERILKRVKKSKVN